ncbi:hypothetical protein OESDEN_19657 [Oesophagostomum dentatum]|uniref:Uncharacterized protein n=1 Tax=Oesophagostomum dentatum TaxID=61180 RepID=A0A0B1S9W4_OESDE|nr:hypothetical protein OESDEN_19657 [Oesophagostomum dentatum]
MVNMQMDTDIIVLDSDDEDSSARSNAPVNGSALASIDIVNSKPLDLDALGIGSASSGEGVLNNNQTQRYYSPRPMETRVQNSLPAMRSKSTTAAAPYMQTITPLSSSSQNSRSYEKARSQPLCEDFGINAISLLGNTPPPRPIPRSAGQMHTRPQSNSPSLRITPRLVPESRVQNYNFEVNGEKSSDSDRHLCPSLKFKVSDSLLSFLFCRHSTNTRYLNFYFLLEHYKLGCLPEFKNHIFVLLSENNP